MYDNADDADGTTADGLTALWEKNADAKNDEPLLVLPIATRRILADEMKRSICCADTIKLDFLRRSGDRLRPTTITERLPRGRLPDTLVII